MREIIIFSANKFELKENAFSFVLFPQSMCCQLEYLTIFGKHLHCDTSFH